MAEVSELERVSEGLQELVQGARGYVVQVSADGAAPRTGVLLDERTVLTVARAAEGGEHISVIGADGQRGRATVKGFDGELRLAVLELESPTAAAELPAQAAAAVGELSLSVGIPADAGLEASLCIVRAVGGPLGLPGGRAVDSYVQLDAPAWPGFAGAPVLNSRGEILGVRALTRAATAAYVIPSKEVLAAVEELREHGSPQWGFLGLRSQEVELPRDAAAATGREQTRGLLVIAVEDETPAARAGIRVADIVVSLAGRATETHDDLIHALRGTAEKQVDVEILRGGSRMVAQVTPGARPGPRRRGGHHGHGPWHRRWKGQE